VKFDTVLVNFLLSLYLLSAGERYVDFYEIWNFVEGSCRRPYSIFLETDHQVTLLDFIADKWGGYLAEYSIVFLSYQELSKE
jgi:hypothetical protein